FLRWRVALTAIGVSVAALSALLLLQISLFPESELPLLSVDEESTYLFNEGSLGLLAKARAFFFHAMVLPVIEYAHGFRLSVQGSGIGEGSLLSGIAAALWAALLALGAWSAVKLRTSKPVIVVVVAIVGQLVLHLAYGVETFMYSAHFGVLLVLLCAFTSLTP